MTLTTRFAAGNSQRLQSSQPLNNDQLMRFAPSIFAEEAHGSRSARYSYIPTIKVLDGLRDEGFMPFFVCQSKSRIEGKSDFTKHMLRLRKVDRIEAPEANEIILINSHDGTSSYQMLAGIFRFVCQNGMVTGDQVEDIRVRHTGNIIDNVIDAAYTITDQFEQVDESMDTMKALTMSRPEQEIFAEAALALKYGEENIPVSVRQVLQPVRYGDEGKDLWSTFNVTQENLIRGGLRGRSANGRRQTTRPVNSIDTDIKLNRSLWILADAMAKLKAN